MRLRSLLFVPGDSERKLQKAMMSGADALILDLEDSVAQENKKQARVTLSKFLEQDRPHANTPLLFVRVNELDGPHTHHDLKAIVGRGVEGIVLPKCGSAKDIETVSQSLDALERKAGRVNRPLKIIGLAAETARDLLSMETFLQGHRRLMGLTWGAEDLKTDLGASINRSREGGWTAPFQFAQTQCLLVAVAANAIAIDTVYADYRDLEGLEKDSIESKSLGFVGRMAIHPNQVAIINKCYAPSKEDLELAKAIVTGFSTNPGVGAIGINGKMYDQPHLKAAKQLLNSVE